MARGLDDAAGHNTEKDCGAAGVEGTVHSGYEGAYAGGTGAIELELLWSIPFLTLLIRCKQSQPVVVLKPARCWAMSSPRFPPAVPDRLNAKVTDKVAGSVGPDPSHWQLS